MNDGQLSLGFFLIVIASFLGGSKEKMETDIERTELNSSANVVACLNLLKSGKTKESEIGEASIFLVAATVYIVCFLSYVKT